MGRLQLNVPQLQRSNRQIPLEEIVAIQGNNPLAQGISGLGEELSKALADKAEIRRAAQKTQFEQGIQTDRLKQETDDKAHQRATQEATIDLELIKLGQDRQLYDPTTNKIQIIKGTRGYTKARDAQGLPYIKAPENMPVEPPNAGSKGISVIPRPPVSSGSGVGSKEEDGWTKLGDHVNSLRQSSRSALGAAAIANQRADRALAVLNNPQATSQDLTVVLTDLGGIFQGGSPHESSLNAQEYNTLKTKVNTLLTYVTSNPQAANQPEVQAKLKEIVADVKNVDNKIVGDNLGVAAVQFEKLIQSDPGRWQRMTEAVNKTTTAPSEQLQPIVQAGPYSDQGKEARYQEWKKQNGR